MKILTPIVFILIIVFPVSGGTYDNQNEVFYESFDNQTYIDENWESRGVNGCVGTSTADGFLSYSIIGQPCLPDQWGADATGIYTQLQKQNPTMIEVHFIYDFPLMGEFGFAGWNPDTNSAWSVSLADSWSGTSGQVKYVQSVNGVVVEDVKTGSGTIPRSGSEMILRITFDYGETITANLEFLGDFVKSHTYLDVPEFTHFSVSFSIKVDFYSAQTIMKIDNYSEYYGDTSAGTSTGTSTVTSNEESTTAPTSSFDTTNPSTSVNVVESSGGGNSLQVVIIIAILLIIAGAFFYQRQQDVPSRGAYTKGMGKRNISEYKQTRTSNQTPANKINQAISCPSCGTVNPQLSLYCIQCGLYLG